MIKKYVMIIAVLLVILMFTSTSTASFLFSKGKIYERLPENSAFKRMLDRFSQIVSNNDNIMSTDADEEDDEDDGEYDDGEYDYDSDDGPEKDVLLPETIDIDGEITHHDGNYTDEGDDENITNTIDYPDGDDDGVVWDNGTVNPDGDVNATNGLTIDEGEWTVKLEWFVEIVTERNVLLGALLERVIERTVSSDTNSISSGSGGTAESEVDVVVVTDGDQ